MDVVSIAQQLLLEKIVDSTKAANTTAMYAILWANKQDFDFSKSQVQTHAARLNRIGIDIRRPYDNQRNSMVVVRECREVVKVFDLVQPAWYRRPVGHLQLVAA